MLAEDERDRKVRTLEEQALFVTALATAMQGPAASQQVLDAYRGEVKQARDAGRTAKAPQPVVATILADPYLAPLAGRIARQARRRRKEKRAADGG